MSIVYDHLIMWLTSTRGIAHVERNVDIVLPRLHMQKHDERQLTCSECEKTFVHYHQLQIHMAKHARNVRYSSHLFLVLVLCAI